MRYVRVRATLVPDSCYATQQVAYGPAYMPDIFVRKSKNDLNVNYNSVRASNRDGSRNKSFFFFTATYFCRYSRRLRKNFPCKYLFSLTECKDVELRIYARTPSSSVTGSRSFPPNGLFFFVADQCCLAIAVATVTVNACQCLGSFRPISAVLGWCVRCSRFCTAVNSKKIRTAFEI